MDKSVLPVKDGFEKDAGLKLYVIENGNDIFNYEHFLKNKIKVL